MQSYVVSAIRARAYRTTAPEPGAGTCGPLCDGSPALPALSTWRDGLSRYFVWAAFTRLDATHDAHQLPEQPAGEPDAEHAQAGREQGLGHDQSQGGDDDLEGQQSL